MIILVVLVMVGVVGCKSNKITEEDVYESDTNVVEETIIEDDVEEITEETAKETIEEAGILEQLREPRTGDLLLTMKTNYGDIEILLFPEVAPKAVENIVTHAENDYYDGVIFHRVMEDFMIQGGDPTGTGRNGESIYGEVFEDEFDAQYFPYRGALCMANSGSNTNGSQFFIVQLGSADDSLVQQMEADNIDERIVEHYKEQGGTAWLYGAHTVFGQVQNGMDVVDAIATVEAVNTVPVKEVIIEDMVVVTVE